MELKSEVVLVCAFHSPLSAGLHVHVPRVCREGMEGKENSETDSARAGFDGMEPFHLAPGAEKSGRSTEI